MSKRASGRISPTAAALMLSAILAAAGQSPAPVPSAGGTPAVRASSQQQSTRTTPSQQQSQRTLMDRIAGPGRDRRRAHNPVRQARRLLERNGVITSGRKWRQFRKHVRKDPHLLALWTQILELCA